MDYKLEKVTIKDVAIKSGVSTGTVSRYLNNRGYIGAEARINIEKAIKELNYMPNTTARSMVNKKSSIIGIVVPEIQNPFLADLVVKIEDNLSKHNYSIMLCNTLYKEDKLLAFIDDLIMRNAEGLILVSSNISNVEMIEKIDRFLKTVSVGQHVGPFDCIKFDDYKSAYNLTNYLISNGHKNIALIGYHKNASQTLERLNGYKKALEDNSIQVNEDYIISAEIGGNVGYSCTKRLIAMPVPPTAIVAINDYYAINAYLAIEENGMQVGGDISVVGFDDVILASLIRPKLTTVRCNTHNMAEYATEILLRNIKSLTQSTQKEVIMPSEIVIRDSVAQK
jgi:LacI family transcriptional regulator